MSNTMLVEEKTLLDKLLGGIDTTGFMMGEVIVFRLRLPSSAANFYQQKRLSATIFFAVPESATITNPGTNSDDWPAQWGVVPPFPLRTETLQF
jgi:hypothetical protein